jgi:hypothetical protein
MNTPANEDAGIAQRNSASNITRADFVRIAWKIRMENLLLSAFSTGWGSPLDGASSLCQLEPLQRKEVALEGHVFPQLVLNRIALPAGSPLF